MGMAASQARYLALVARKSNCEFEGQQINQARTALSNQSANLFNQMLGLQVPVPPSTQDFTRIQYSYTDGFNSSTISNWQQLANDPDYNYVVTHYYYTDRYTGSLKKLSDPQVQFSNTQSQFATAAQIQAALKNIETTYEAYEAAKLATDQAEAAKADLSEYASPLSVITTSFVQNMPNAPNCYSVDDDGTPPGINYYSYDDAIGINNCITPPMQTAIDEILKTLISQGVLTGVPADHYEDLYYSSGTPFPQNFNITFKDDLEQLNGVGGTSTELTCYNHHNVIAQQGILNTALASAQTAEIQALQAYNNALDAYENLCMPTYVGNSELTPLSTLSDIQLAEINQVIEDLRAEGIDNELENCFDANGNYLGGIFSFSLAGVTYYTTLEDLKESYTSGTGINNIDGQIKLCYYNATYIKTMIEETERALLETDGNGRFSSVRFENDSVTYTLNTESVTDEVAYEDAMNQYLYENAKYDKMIQDINARTSIIHQQDQQLELRLKQLDTEHNALSTEMDAVQKVVQENVKNTFKTFGG